jgi:hypothetical protein
MSGEGAGLVLYSPSDQWPEHPKAYWRAALKHARRNGWYLNVYSAHAFGQVRCSSDLQSQNTCTYKVFSSGKGGESAAKECQKKVDNCPHRTQATESEGADERLARAADHLTKAGRLLDAAERCVERERQQYIVDELLKNAEANLEQYEQLMAQAIEAEKQTELAAQTARQSLVEAGEAGLPSEVTPIAEVAGSHVVQAESELQRVGDHPDRLRLTQLARSLRDRVCALGGDISEADGPR